MSTGNEKKRTQLVLMESDSKIEKLVNYIMKQGKKNIARKILEGTLKVIKENGHTNPRVVIDTALENAAPQIMVKSRRVGGSVYSIPLEVKPEKKLYFAVKWILDAAKSKKGKPMYQKLSEEFLAAYSNTGSAIKRKEEVHKMAEANKAYSYMAKYVK